MPSNATRCSTWQLYVIVDRQAAKERDLLKVALGAIRGGADVVQLRDKTASTAGFRQTALQLRALTQASRIPLILNDRTDLVEAVGADGVHLGQDDLSIAEARRLLGPGRLIGRSTHSLEQALDAQAQGADYIGVGPIFSTPTKPTYPSIGTALIRTVAARVHIPRVCIGGIDLSNLEEVLKAGAECVAVVRALCAAEDPEKTARDFKETIAHFLHPTDNSPYNRNS
jgi:thiamine-phosphate pyrophosphorylase